jgi:hypothetical protein
MGGYLINFFSADDLIPYGADGAVLAPIAITLERLSERQHRDRVIYGLAD